MMGIANNSDPVSQLSLPPGFRFYPTDEELLVQYLCRKVAGYNFSLNIIGEIDLYKFDPWVLPSKAIFGEKEWYFFSPRDRKYPNGSRPNRVAGSGYWKATGTDKIITTEGRKVGIKKALVFYIGKAPKGTKTNWIMHEYRLLENSKKHGSSRLDDWVLCRIYKKNFAISSSSEVNSITTSKEQSSNGTSSSSSSSQFDDVLDSLPEINDQFFSLPRMNSLKNFQDQENKLMMNFQNLDTSKFDWSSLAAMASLPELDNNSNQAIGRSTTNNQAYPDSLNYHVQPVNSSSNGRSSMEEEVESRSGSQQRVNSANYFQQNSSDFLQNYNNDSFDSFGIRYLTEHPVSGGSFGYKV